MRMVLIAALLAGGCVSESQPKPRAAARGTGTGLCPLVRRGAVVVAEDVPGAASLVISMPDTNPMHTQINPQLDRDWARQLARRIADQHESRRIQGRPPGQLPGLPPHTVAVEYTGDGARLLYRPLSEAGLDALRAGVHDKAQRMPVDCSSRVARARR